MMNKKIRKLMDEKKALYNHPDAFKNTTLLDKELLSIANAVKAVYSEIECPSEDDKVAYDWAVKEAAWEWR